MGRASGGRAAKLEPCPLCGRQLHGKTKTNHAERHLLQAERKGVLKIRKEENAWVVYYGNKKYYGLGWQTLLALAENIPREVIPETRRVSGG